MRVAVKGMRVWTCALCAFLLAVALPTSAAAAAGDLDDTFSVDGKVITNVTVGYDWTVGLVLQDDGKIVTAGQASGAGGRFYVVRYLDDGGLDTGFGGDGVVFTNFTSRGDYGYDVTLDLNDRILVVGGVGGGGGRFGLARYLDDGTLDPAFGGGDGMVTTNFSARNDYAYNVVIQPDGQIVAVGRAGGSGGRFALARYNDDGSLDDTFGGDGRVTTNFTSGNDYVDDIALVDADTIIAAGTANIGRRSKFALAQYDMNDGHLDSTFGGDGKVTTNLTRRLDGAWGVAVQSGVGIVATGPAGENVGLVRYTLTGSLDPTFSGDGIRKTNWSSGVDWSDEIALDGMGRIVVVGIANVFGNDPRLGLSRYAENGAPDFTKLTNLTGGLDYGLDVQIEGGTDKIVVTGAVRNGLKSFVTRHLSQ